MPSFDVISKVNYQEFDNALANCLREISNRYDFKGLNILSLIHISEPTRQAEISYAVFCLKKKK